MYVMSMCSLVSIQCITIRRHTMQCLWRLQWNSVTCRRTLCILSWRNLFFWSRLCGHTFSLQAFIPWGRHSLVWVDVRPRTSHYLQTYLLHSMGPSEHLPGLLENPLALGLLSDLVHLTTCRRTFFTYWGLLSTSLHFWSIPSCFCSHPDGGF